MHESPRHDHMDITYCEPPHIDKVWTENKGPRPVEDQHHSLLCTGQSIHYLYNLLGIGSTASKNICDRPNTRG